jgi:hypothetical protein
MICRKNLNKLVQQVCQNYADLQMKNLVTYENDKVEEDNEDYDESEDGEDGQQADDVLQRTRTSG